MPKPIALDAGSGRIVPGIRAATVAHLRDRMAAYNGREDMAAKHMRAYFTTMIADLETGAAARVPRRSIPRGFAASLPPGDGNAWYVIGRDESVRLDDG